LTSLLFFIYIRNSAGEERDHMQLFPSDQLTGSAHDVAQVAAHASYVLDISTAVPVHIRWDEEDNE